MAFQFARVGAATRALNMIIPFWNAQVQGTDRKRPPLIIRTFFIALALALAWALAWSFARALDAPIVYRSMATGECVRVLSPDDRYTCETVPDWPYMTTWVP